MITCATYNENGGWDSQNERALLSWLDNLDKNNIKFALSNVLSSKGKTNNILTEWAKKYSTIYLNHNYSNSNYQTKDRSILTEEVLIVNFISEKI